MVISKSPVLVIALLVQGCAAPTLPRIRAGESVSVSVVDAQPTGSVIPIHNEAMGQGVTTGAGTGALAGGLWGLACGPFAPLCVPVAATFGAVAGSAAGAGVGLTGALSNDQASKLRARVLQIEASHDLRSELQRSVEDRARKYWTLDPDLAPTIVTIEIQALQLTSTRDERVRCQVTALVAVTKRGDAPAAIPRAMHKPYEYAGSFSDLSVWLDEDSDFVDTSLTSAAQQMSAQIVSELASK